jgi:glycosyltransferase involved in cell wall biosynthesis
MDGGHRVTVRILIIVDCYYPTTKSSAKLVHDLGVELCAQGHQVTVLAPSDAITNRSQVTMEDALRVVRVRTGKIKGAALIARAWREARLSSVLWHGAKEFLAENPHEGIVFYSPSIFFGALVQRLKKLWQCRSYLILRDIFPQWAVDAGILKKGFVYQYFRRRELQQYAAADVIGVQTPANLKYFAEQLQRERYRLEVLFNWTPIDEPNAPPSAYRSQLGLNGKVVFFFGGNLGVAQDMDNILRLAESLKAEPQVTFLLVGEGSEVPRLKKEIEEKRLTNVLLLPAVGQQEYLAMLSEVDVGLISLDKRLTTQNVPGKLMGYVQYSKPVLASVNENNDLKQILDDADAGFCLLNGDDDGLKLAALRLAQDVVLRSRMGANSRRLLEKTFAAPAAARQIVNALTVESRAESGESPKSLHPSQKS